MLGRVLALGRRALRRPPRHAGRRLAQELGRQLPCPWCRIRPRLLSGRALLRAAGAASLQVAELAPLTRLVDEAPEAYAAFRGADPPVAALLDYGLLARPEPGVPWSVAVRPHPTERPGQVVGGGSSEPARSSAASTSRTSGVTAAPLGVIQA